MTGLLSGLGTKLPWNKAILSQLNPPMTLMWSTVNYTLPTNNSYMYVILIMYGDTTIIPKLQIYIAIENTSVLTIYTSIYTSVFG